MATVGGSGPAGHGDRLGRIEAGAKADLIVIPADIPALAPLNDPLRQLVLGASGRDVRDVVVDGEVVVRDRALTGVDEEKMLKNARRFADAEFSAAPVGEDAALRLESLLGGLMERTRSYELEVDSYIPS